LFDSRFAGGCHNKHNLFLRRGFCLPGERRLFEDLSIGSDGQENPFVIRRFHQLQVACR
jgi:hypothetical protein